MCKSQITVLQVNIKTGDESRLNAIHDNFEYSLLNGNLYMLFLSVIDGGRY